MKLIAALAASAALSTAAFAQTPAATEPAPTFTVIEADARLAFAHQRIIDYQVARDDSLILRAGVNRWYRATVWEPCARELRWAYDRIGIDTRGGGTLDRFSTVIVRGHRCSFRTLDRIEPPLPGTRY